MRSKSLLKAFMFLALTCALPMAAQSPSGTLRIQVLDPSGAAVVDAVVLVTSATGEISAAETNRNGLYEVTGLMPGVYSVQVTAQGFAPFDQKGVEVSAGKPRQIEVPLELETQQEKIQVEGEAPNVGVNPEGNVSSIVIKGADLEALSDDPEDLADDLRALAGPAAGPNGGQIYIDGFSDGRLPPKSAIREIRVNQNPFSAQYTELGYGRTEIFTKPGSDSLHGQVGFHFNHSALNSRNPFVTSQPRYHFHRIAVDLGGPINKKASYFINFERRKITDTAIINAIILDSNFDPTSFSDAVPNPRWTTVISPRFDFQLATNNTFSLRYEGEFGGHENNGLGLFNLPSQAVDGSEDEQRFYITDTHIFGANIVNETRYMYQRRKNEDSPLDFSPTVRVLSAFTGGGNNDGFSSLLHNHHELQNYTSISRGKHLVKVGGRLRVITDANDGNSNFNGTFTFGSLDAYRLTEIGLQQGLTGEEIRAAGGGADQFLIVAGNPFTRTRFTDLGLYAEDDWRVRNNLSVSLGVRYETQNAINDHLDFAPRVGLAWGLGGGKGGAPKTVIRAGFGLFYDRFSRDQIMQVTRLNGENQEQYVVPLPDFYPDIPNPSMIAANVTQPTIYSFDPQLKSPYLMQTAASFERQLSKVMTASVTYVNTRGTHQFMTRNINAPLPGTYDPADPTSGERPFGNVGNLYQYEASGIYRQNQVISNFNIRGSKWFSGFGNYTLNYARGNTAGASSFPLNQYDLTTSYGRTSYDVRHRVFVGGTFSLPRAIRLNPFMFASSGSPFNFTVGEDLNGDSIFNDRPGLATDPSSPTAVETPWGLFDTMPVTGERIVAPNYGTGPAYFSLNMRFSKVFGFGKVKEDTSGGSGGSGGHGPHRRRGGGLGPRGLSGGGGFGGWGDENTNTRFKLTLSIFARNLLNIVNLAPPIGNLSSPLFGESNAVAGGGFAQAANRRFMFLATLTF